jgi:hypothetical protein
VHLLQGYSVDVFIGLTQEVNVVEVHSSKGSKFSCFMDLSEYIFDRARGMSLLGQTLLVAVEIIHGDDVVDCPEDHGDDVVDCPEVCEKLEHCNLAVTKGKMFQWAKELIGARCNKLADKIWEWLSLVWYPQNVDGRTGCDSVFSFPKNLKGDQPFSLPASGKASTSTAPVSN